MKRLLLSTVSALMLTGSFALPARAVDTQIAAPELSPAQAALAELLKRGSAQNVPLMYPQNIAAVYKQRNYEPFWTAKGKVTKKADAALDVLEDSWSHGLSPSDYNTKLLRQMAEAKLEPRQSLEFEMLLSDAVAHYGHDMTGMRVSARKLGEDTKSWSQGVDAAQALTFVMSDPDVETSLEQFAPHGRLYQAMRGELRKIVKDVAENPDKDRPDLKYPGAIYPGEKNPAIAEIRARMGQSEKAGDRNIYYDDALAQAVAKFQRANGLKGDAIIGKRTFAAINQGRRDKLIKLIANLERQRWMDPRLPSRYIVVNIPAMMLWGIDKGDIKIEMPVVVGRDKRPTNSFIATITGIRFNPSWNVPDTIKTEDFLPALQKDPAALTKKGIELVRYTPDGAETIAPESVDWSTMTPESIRSIGMIQDPGDTNALGRIRVLMPNQYNIYLHDTNSPDLFSRDFRALSSGCVRVAEPKKVAAFILGENKGWSDEKLKTYLDKSKTVEIRAEKQLPVFILYQTVWLDDQGDLVYGDDLYGNDIKLVHELQRTGQLALPVSL